jgi:hypothetical protein
MLDENQTAAAAKTLHDHWQAGTKIGGLDPSQRPRDRIGGYAVQAAMQRYGKPVGWKIAATSEAGQKHINVAGPLAGRLFAERMVSDAGTAPMAGNEMRVGSRNLPFASHAACRRGHLPIQLRRFLRPSTRCIRRSNCRIPVSRISSRPERRN